MSIGEEVYELADILYKNKEYNLFWHDCIYLADQAVKQGYRKQSAIIDEFVKRLKDTSMTKWDYHEAVDVDEIDRVAAIMKGDMN